MWKIRWAIAALIGFAPAAHAQTLVNAGFEAPYLPFSEAPVCPPDSGAIAQGWLDNSCWAGNESVAVAYTPDAAAPHGGGSAQRITAQGGVVHFAQPVTFQGGRLYSATVWLRSAVPMEVTLMLRRAGAPYNAFGTRTCAVTAAWTAFTVHGLTEPLAGYVMLRFVGPGTLWVDDASLDSEPWSAPLPAASVPPEYFGMHLHWSDLPWPVALGPMRAVRIWDADGPQGASSSQWAGIHIAPGEFAWGALDQHVQRAQAQGARVLMNLGRSPRWASARPDEPSPYGPGQAAEPADIQVWRDWVSAVGTRYQGRIREWEIWNEPNDAQFYTGSIETLVTLAREARDILEAIDPANVMVSPSPYDLGWLERYLELGGGDVADVIGYHFYILGQEPEVLYDSYIPSAKVIQHVQGMDAKPLWNTEAGWFAPPALADDLAAAYVARSYLLNWARGIERFYFYAWDAHWPPEGAGIALSLPPDFTQPTAGGIAYRVTAEWLLGARMTDLAKDAQGTWWIELTRPNASRAYVVWNPAHTAAAPITFAVPAAWQVNWKRDLAGAVTPFIGTTLAVERRPVALEQAAVTAAPAPMTHVRLSAPGLVAGAGVVHIAFELPRGMRAELAVYDAAGRRLARLASGELAAGRHEREWDVSTARVAAGVHFVVLRSAAGAEVRRVVVTR